MAKRTWWEKRGLKSDPRKKCLNCSIKYIPTKNYHGYYCLDCREHWHKHGEHRVVK